MTPDIDPVCGMTAAEDKPHHPEHEGQQYRFFSRKCLDNY